MAELFNARWIKQGPYQTRHDSSTSLRQSISEESVDPKTPQLENAVLMNILAILTKMDTKMQVQTRRLEKLEITSPSSSHGDSTLLDDSPISRGLSTRTTASKGIVVIPGDEEKPNEYAQSISKLDWDTDGAESFVYAEMKAPDVVSIRGESRDGQEEAHPARNNWGDLVSGHLQTDGDVYSVSMYTGDLMGSKMSLGSPPQPPSENVPQPLRISPSPPATESETDGEGIENQPEEDNVETEGPIEGLSTYKDVSTDFGDRDAVPEPKTRKRISINVFEAGENASYIKIELRFHAYDLWKQGKERMHELRQTHLLKNLAEQLVSKLRSASERTKEEKRMRSLQPRKKGVKLFKWRIVISLDNVFQVNREQSQESVGR